MSGIVNRVDTGIQWFSGDIELTAYGYDAIKVLHGFMMSLRGRLNAFEIKLGGAYGNDKITTNPKLNGAHSIGANNIKVTYGGLKIPYGSVFTLPNDKKLYTLASSITGSGTYSVIPSLKTTHASTEPCNFKDPVFTAILDANETTINHTMSGKIATASIAWREAFNG
tara:strand:+ start:1985 stop:2488 length:504 start_codon:yes stop_codon:yes gene_type:complete